MRESSASRLTLRGPVSFVCLEGCGLCCSYRVSVTEGEAARVEQGGHKRAGFLGDGRLLKRDGFCVFLDENRRCAVYERRPRFCRSFPVYFEEAGEADVDLSCPGVGWGGLAAGGESLTNPCSEFEEACGEGHSDGSGLDAAMASALPGGLSREEFEERGMEWLDGLDQTHSIADLAESARARARSSSPIAAYDETLLGGFFDIAQSHNVHVSGGNSLTLYPFETAGQIMRVEGVSYPLADEGISETCRLVSDDAARRAAILIEYLRAWFRRSLFHRFCSGVSLAAPMIHPPMTVAFLFAAILVGRIERAAEVLAAHWQNRGMSLSGVEALKESIRAFDGRLRTKCRTATVLRAQ